MWTDFDPWRAGAVAADVMAVSQGSPELLAQRQRQRLAELLDAAQASPLYRERLAARPDAATLDGIAPVGKRELMQRFDDWVVDPRLRLPALQSFIADPSRIGQPFDGGYVVWESSGSSGEPGVFVQDAQAMAVYDALEGLRRAPLQPWRRWLDPWCLAERIAFVGATTGHFASTVSAERLRRLQPGLARRLCGISFLQPVADLVAQLQAHAPTVLATYPTAALMLAAEARAGRLRLALTEVWTGGEALSAPMRAEIEASFGCPVAHSYGASEFLALASPCRCGALHLNSDWVILEAVDARGRAVPPGQAGATTWLTNLANHVQPLIRYDLGDRVTFHARPCACGSPLPAIDVQGRADELLCLHDVAGRAVRLPPLAVTTVLEEEGGVLDFQLVQTAASALQLTLGPRHDTADVRRARAALQAFLRLHGLPRVTLSVACRKARVLGRSGKLPRVVGWRGRHA